MLKKLTLSTLGLIFYLCSGCAVNPITGQDQFMLIPEQQDITIGQEYSPEVEKQMGGRIANEDLQDYIDNVGQKIARIGHRPNWEYHFIAVQDKTINAVALPGGYVFVTKAMLQKLKTEAQLAAILAHEMTHIVARDSSAAISRQIGIDILLSAVASQETPQGVLLVADLAGQILNLQYSREQEWVADLGGLDYMVRAGYNPYGAVEVMHILQSQREIRPVEFFSTHPSPQNRIDYLTQRIQTDYYGLEDLKVGEEDYRKAVLGQLSNQDSQIPN
ncbi:MAG: M48 family metalloprotease [Planctomycetota bacterium]|jgi:predicted Zn-dependent protease